MAVYKVNYFFKQRDWGWSETFYTIQVTAADARAAAKSLIPTRVALLGGTISDGSSPYMKEVRISNVQIQRDSLIYRVPTADGWPQNPLGTADIPTSAIELRLQSGDLYRRTLWISGQPDSLIAQNGVYVVNPLWERLLGLWVFQLIAAQMGIYATVKPPDGGGLIRNVTLLPLTRVQIETTGPHGLVDQDSVRIVSAPGVKGIQGNWRVLVVDLNNFNLLGAAATGSYLGGGKWYKRTPSVQQINEVIITGAAKKSRGRPFDSPVGRRRRRVRA